MRMRATSRTLALLTSTTVLLSVAEAQAADRGAFIWDGDYWGFDYEAFEQGLASGGASPVERALALPADLSPYNLVIVVLPATAPGPAEASALVEFVDRGGALVLVSDYDGYSPEPSGVFNALLPELGVEARFTTGGSYGCSDAAIFHPHPLTTGLTVFHSSAPDHVIPGPATQVVVETPDNEPFLGVERNVILLADSNPINTAICSPELTNIPFFANLPAFACDVDGDGVSNASCDGDDPDDLDPAVTEPGQDTTGSESTGSETGDATSGDATGGDTTGDDPTGADPTGGAGSTTAATGGEPGGGSDTTSAGGATTSSSTDDEGGCGCRSDGDGRSAAWLMLLGLVLRRRRQ
ncbi:MYXO-CTERM sorting domain-containing protein [Nannocystis pusilla]|uniref:MYXO-CTERM sorting domain-containing protein n=1 Tax=Nannocystis pusilla TaxID=889268 RepID=A0A9X3IYH1_9BACT|nr:DUF4350 domain-containing protein [Nannocystis pusilla]MCY1009537.1 MYXO-CTERM sorting domain-containing protein [Nannocystis pusilla]